jgi:hypothetical protein
VNKKLQAICSRWKRYFNFHLTGLSFSVVVTQMILISYTSMACTFLDAYLVLCELNLHIMLDLRRVASMRVKFQFITIYTSLAAKQSE